ncbi:MAG: hypothetical protein FJX75_21715 [Armatimonadetes bacterium]|nr:hypothetical protein [Armatimonadota bacterium]
MRYLLILGLLALTVGAFADGDPDDTSAVTLSIDQYLNVVLAPAAVPWTPVGGAEGTNYDDPTYAGDATWNGVATVGANNEWDLATTANDLASAADSINCNDDGTALNEQAIPGGTPAVTISWDRSGLNDHTGVYNATVTVTVTVD